MSHMSSESTVDLSAASNVPPEAFLGFMNAELERMERDDSRPGWSRWALAAAGGTILWTLLQEVSSTTATFTMVFLLVTAMIRTWRVFEYVRHIIKTLCGATPKELRFRWFRVGSQYDREHVALRALFDLCVLLLFLALNDIPWWIVCLGSLWASAALLCDIVLVLQAVRHFAPEPIQTPRLPRGRRQQLIGVAIAIAFSAAFAYAVIDFASRSFPGWHQSPLRIAALVFGLFCVADLWLRQSRPTSVPDAVYDIRRSFASGELPLDGAKTMFRLATVGVMTNDVARDIQERATHALAAAWNQMLSFGAEIHRELAKPKGTAGDESFSTRKLAFDALRGRGRSLTQEFATLRAGFEREIAKAMVMVHLGGDEEPLSKLKVELASNYDALTNALFSCNSLVDGEIDGIAES